MHGQVKRWVISWAASMRLDPTIFNSRKQRAEYGAHVEGLEPGPVEAHAGADGPQFELPKPIGAGSMPTMRVKRAA